MHVGHSESDQPISAHATGRISTTHSM